eukprot:153175-Amphidinium_carterae.1
MAWMKNLLLKIALVMQKHAIPPHLDVNADEIAVRLLPAKTYGWSTKGAKVQQLQLGKVCGCDCDIGNEYGCHNKMANFESLLHFADRLIVHCWTCGILEIAKT